MNNQQFERLVHNLQDIMRCPHCSAKYGLEDIHYLGQLDAMTFLHMRCNSCKTPVFASVALTNPEGDVIPTDITATDVVVSDTPPAGQEMTDTGFEQRALEVAPEIQEATPQAQEIPVKNISVDELFTSLNPISYNDVLDTYEHLKKFDGDFEQLFGGSQ